MGKQVGILTYWLGSLCAFLALVGRSLDFFGKNFIDFETKGAGFGYHSLMDATLFFYAISIATMVHSALISPKEGSRTQESEPVRE